jgi:hypothetical protein
MAKIRIRVRLNKGRIGIPLYKLGAIVKETEAFFSMLGQDIELPGDKKQWLGLDFENSDDPEQSAKFIELAKEHPVSKEEFEELFKKVTTTRRNRKSKGKPKETQP